VRRAGVDPVGARLHELDEPGLGIAALALGHTSAHAVARDTALHEQDVAVEARDARAAVGERVHAQLELLALLGACALGRPRIHAHYAGSQWT
jgi:predicted DNA-binding protein with PD1-like motif